MVELVLEDTDVLRVNAAIVVVFEVLSHVDTARDGAMSEELGLHLVNTLNIVILANIVLGILDCGAILKSRVTLCWRGSGAVTANVDWFAEAVLKVVGNVLHA